MAIQALLSKHFFPIHEMYYKRSADAPVCFRHAVKLLQLFRKPQFPLLFPALLGALQGVTKQKAGLYET